MDRRSDYHFHLPEAQIAQVPTDRRDGSRLLVVPATGDPETSLIDRQFADICELLPKNAILVVNDTRVFPARLRTRKPTGGAVELLFLEQLPADESANESAAGQRWRCLARSSKKLRAGTTLAVQTEGAELPASVPTAVSVVTDRATNGTVTIEVPGDAYHLLEHCGAVPLPPYIARPDGVSNHDVSRYQTVYARERGAVAAPTAGLHFTEPLLDALRSRGVDIVPITLHVGLGTFAPMRAESLEEHRMHTERYVIPDATADLLDSARGAGRPIAAVGTTCVRALESAALRADPSSLVARGSASTDLFIRPGFQFRVVDQLITNFHLPESTLLMMICAFLGYQRTMTAYRHAVSAGYRFFSYGDAMLVSRAPAAIDATPVAG